MASQLAIELTLDTQADCIVADMVTIPAASGASKHRLLTRVSAWVR